MEAPAQIVRRAELHSGFTFLFAGRFLRVVKSYGTDAAAPVVVEELMAVGEALPGQFSLWALGGIPTEMAA